MEKEAAPVNRRELEARILAPLALVLRPLEHGRLLDNADGRESPAGMVRNRQLPELLRTSDGRAIMTPDEWFEIRRPELRRLFQSQVYGAAPPPPTQMRYSPDCADFTTGDGLATVRQVAITPIEGGPTIHLLIWRPTARRGRLLGTTGVGASPLPDPVEMNSLVGETLAYHIRPDGHGVIRVD